MTETSPPKRATCEGSARRTGQDGFTLIEAMVALAIVALVVTTCLMFRTGALIDATEARNWRVAREVAQEILSELQAGAREEPPAWDMAPQPIPSMKDVDGWSYQIVIGEERIATIEGDLEAQMDSERGEFSDSSITDRRAWQKERDDLRAARQKGVSYYDYRETTALEEADRIEREEAPPSDDEFEDVAVFVFFPNARIVKGQGGEFAHFVLKARLSTMAIEGLTPEEAETIAKSQGESSTTPGSEGAAEGGTSK